jgi:uncharacterized phage protein (TIGR02218 family)
MSKTMSVEMLAKLAISSKRLAKMLRIERTDGTVVCLTDHDQDLTYDLLGDGDEVYSASALTLSDVSLAAGLDPSNVEGSGPLSDDITLAGLLGGRFNAARCWLFEVDWSDLSIGHIPGIGGEVGDARPRGSSFTLDIRDLRQRLQQVVGRAMINTCEADHTLPIDPKCGRTPETDTATVVSAVDGMQMTVTLLTGGWADGYFNKGEVRGETGNNIGVKLKIEDYDSATGVIKLFGFLPATPEAGDEFTLIRGCGKTRPDCMERENMVNFRGEPDSPGDDQLRRPTIPGQNSE